MDSEMEFENSNDMSKLLDDQDVDDMEVHVKQPLKTVDNAIDYWDSALEKGSLSCHHFREWWRRIVPKILSPTPTMDYQAPLSHIDEELVVSQLLKPLERFICNGDPEEVMKTLSKLNDPPAQCGKLFKMGEPTYSCRDCSHDPTCVLCVDCFKNSEHRHHRYKMSTSCGGGYCDCGDGEAWNDHVHCAIHILGTQHAEKNMDPLDKMPKHIQERTRHVFASVMKYTYEILTAEATLNLPADLTFKHSESSDHPMESMESEDSYSTVVYNDEVHTFDEVITTLPRAVDCDRTAAIGFATIIDREGRAIVKCSGFQTCNEAKRITDRITSRRGGKPLKVVIMHSHVIAHQNFAMRLLGWLQNRFLDFSSGFRRIFSSIVLQKDAKERRSLVEMICRHDTRFWKSARNIVHHLLVSGMFMESEAKRQFACEFTKSYGHIMKDFIQDDHEHSFSVTSLSVQLFTVPTLAHHLIAHEDVLAILLRTFMSECERKRNDKGKIEFQRNLNLQSYRRSYFILYDLKYLLTTVPNHDWDDSLRKGFLHGVSLLFEILVWMQGMDQQIRQVSHHVEYELEWESAFNLHIKLAPFSTLISTWCGTDRIVFIKAVRMLFKKMHEDQLKTAEESSLVDQEVCGKTTACVDYQVSSKPISIHLPLTRMLSGLCLHMGRFDLDFRSHELNITERPTMVQMMEPALRTLVLVAQVQAGMWRRNGYALVDQVRVYHDPRCRKEMYDQDIIMLQMAAANMDSEEYLINMLNKFQLINWASSSFDCSEDDSIRQVTTLVEEFLATLIIVLGERNTPGVGSITPEEALKKEIVQLLCIEPMSHSALNKALAEDVVNRETGMEKVIESVATFKKPFSGTGKGIYELKEEFYDEYNVFFYHYSREEQSKSEEAQRARKKAANLPRCNPPPSVPPFAKQFQDVVRIMDCDIFVHLLSLVLQRADNLKTRCFSETQVHKAIHLIGMCLNEEERKGEDVEPRVKFTEKASKYNILGLLEQLVGNQRIDSHKELLAWVLRKWKQVTGEQVPERSLASTSAGPSSGKSSSSSFDPEAEEKSRRAAVAAARRAKIMAQMKSAQNNFMKENSQLFEETALDKQRTDSVSTEVMELEEITSSSSSAATVSTRPVCLGVDKSSSVTVDNHFTCILCQEEEVLTAEGPALVMAAFVQKSTVLSRRRYSDSESSSSEAAAMQPPPQYASCPILLADMLCAPHTSSCGHIMHSACWQKFYDDIVSHERQRSTRLRHPHSFDIERQEFLCPLCRCLSNAVVPLIPQFHVLQPKPAVGEVQLQFSDWIQALLIALKYKRELSEPTLEDILTGDDEVKAEVLAEAEAGLELGESLVTVPVTVDLALQKKAEQIPLPPQPPSRKRYYTCPLDQIVQELGQQGKDSASYARLYTGHEGSELQFSASVFEMMNLFSKAVFQNGLDMVPDLHDERIPLIVWQSCAFTIHSIVWSILDQGKSIFGTMSSRQNDCLSTLVRFCGVVGSNFGEPKVIRSHSLKLLSALLEVDTSNLCVLEFDAFGMLVALTFSLPSLFNVNQPAPLPSANIQDQHILHTLLVLHFVQILLTTDQFSADDEDDDEDDYIKVDADFGRHDSEDKSASARTTDPVIELLHLVRESVGFAAEGDGTEGLKPSNVWRDLKFASLPFLRCCAIFYHHLSSVPVPEDLRHFEDDEFDVLMRYLGLPSSPSELLRSPQLLTLARKWANHPNVHIMLAPTARNPPATYPMKIHPLVPLPQDYSELINSLSSFTCPKSISDDSRVPAMCLVCGEIMCSQSYCCQTTLEGEQIGACCAHAERCGAGNGIFLRIRECKVVLLSGRKKGCFIPPPYLDQYGETDQGLRRGNPLSLCPDRLRKIHKLWLNHGIPEEIAHALESNLMLVATPWHHL